MSRVLLVDDSPHAQRIGERILSEEGFEVVTVSNADSALIRLEDVDPDVVLADTVMPGRTGYEICQYIKMSPRHRHVRVILTAGVLETLDEANAKRVEADTTLRKPFEASALTAAVKPLAEAAARDRATAEPDKAPAVSGKAAQAPAAPFIAVVDEEQVRAAVTVALDAAMGAMVDEITKHVLAAIAIRKPEGPPSAAAASYVAPQAIASPAAAPPIAPAQPITVNPMPNAPEAPKESDPERVRSRVEPVRRVSSPLRLRSGSILGLDISRPESEDEPADPRP
jgi:CheY-like chemotaxis protein